MTARKRFEDCYKPDPETGCWLWQGSVGSHGYGILRHPILKKKVTAHRFAYEKYVGAIPAGLFVCHHCDVRKCVNPSHFFIGTRADNMNDMFRKQRDIKNDTTVYKKLTREQAREIKAMPIKRGDRASIAERYGVNPFTISEIRLGRTWARV